MPRPRLALLLLALPIAACGRRDVPITAEPGSLVPVLTAEPAPGGPASPEQILPRSTNGVLPPGAADKIMPIGAQPVVKLLEPGAAPRSDLSYALVKGTSNKMRMSLDMTMSVKAGGQSAPQMPIPRMTMTFDTTHADKNPAGEFKVDAVLSSVGIEPNGGQQEQMANALRPQLEAMKGLAMSYWVSPKGQARDVKLTMPPNIPPAAKQLLNGMSQSFESMVTPLPAEAVGVGARWSVVSRTANGGADLLQAAVYTLKARTGNRATLDVGIVQLAANDTIHGPQMPANMSAKVKAFHSSGAGSSQIDLKSISPEAGTMTLKTGMDLAVQGAGPDSGGTSTVETTTTVQIARP